MNTKSSHLNIIITNTQRYSMMSENVKTFVADKIKKAKLSHHKNVYDNVITIIIDIRIRLNGWKPE
ncbi:CLUMA_CG010631, isoform A [Clunio marinus]|uniref:CLUMA_CG010631, isoform A n=1 Tax=Clunio marinus TaxID=568069 RepID=A0A1J1IAJ3_9DIPT|nr:CLUMA_CG010631, isoform A [Clunio marinus]